jgi:hypothetical protein
MADQVQEILDVPREFLKDGIQFINRAQKRTPSSKNPRQARRDSNHQTNPTHPFTSRPPRIHQDLPGRWRRLPEYGLCLFPFPRPPTPLERKKALTPSPPTPVMGAVGYFVKLSTPLPLVLLPRPLAQTTYPHPLNMLPAEREPKLERAMRDNNNNKKNNNSTTN